MKLAFCCVWAIVHASSGSPGVQIGHHRLAPELAAEHEFNGKDAGGPLPEVWSWVLAHVEVKASPFSRSRRKRPVWDIRVTFRPNRTRQVRSGRDLGDPVW